MSHPVDWPIVGEVMQDGTSEETVIRESYVKIESDYVKIEIDGKNIVNRYYIVLLSLTTLQLDFDCHHITSAQYD